MFHAILAFLLYHKVKYNGALGGHFISDAAVGLAPVIEPPVRGSLAVPPVHSVWGWWFPPSHDKEA
jgi:hypothetical protein